MQLTEGVAPSDTEQIAEATSPFVKRSTGALVLVSIGLANASNYGFQIITGRFLGAEAYGLLAGLLAVVSVIAVAVGSLQTVTAKAVSSGEAAPGSHVFDHFTRSTVRWGLVIAGALALLSPLLARLLNVGVLLCFVVALYVVPAAMSAIAVGRLQGQQRFIGMAALSASFAVVKLGVGITAAVLGFGVTALVVGLVIATSGCAMVGLWAARSAGDVGHHLFTGETGRVFLGTTLFWVLISLDVPVARSVFSENLAGQYAAAAVVGRAVLWLPAVITDIAFPQLSRAVSAQQSTQRVMLRAFWFTTCLSLLGVAGIGLFGGPIFRLLYGSQYPLAASIAWRVALATVPFTIVNLLLYHRLARTGRWFIGVLGVAIGGEALGFALAHSSPNALVAVLGIVGVVTAISLVPAGGWRLFGRVRPSRTSP